MVHHEEVDVNLVCAGPPHILVIWGKAINLQYIGHSLPLTGSPVLDELHAAPVTLHGVGHVLMMEGEVEGVKTSVRDFITLFQHFFLKLLTPGIMVGVAVKTCDLLPG